MRELHQRSPHSRESGANPSKQNPLRSDFESENVSRSAPGSSRTVCPMLYKAGNRCRRSQRQRRNLNYLPVYPPQLILTRLRRARCALTELSLEVCVQNIKHTLGFGGQACQPKPGASKRHRLAPVKDAGSRGAGIQFPLRESTPWTSGRKTSARTCETIETFPHRAPIGGHSSENSFGGGHAPKGFGGGGFGGKISSPKHFGGGGGHFGRGGHFGGKHRL